MTLHPLAEAKPERPVRLGRYDVTGLIRAGGMGTVFDALDREHGTRVALKTLNHLSAGNLLRFKAEFRHVAELSHPNLVALYELGCHEALWFFTMERIDGVDFVSALRGVSIREMRTLEERRAEPTLAGGAAGEGGAPHEAVTPTPPPSIDALRDRFAQLARGVRALHAAGLVHLDLKPSNVLVEPSGRVVVVDFGLARSIEAAREGATDAGSISGTPAWMAPEQYVGEGIGPAADWYAVGLLLYLALTGVPAFPPASVPVLAYAKRSAPPPSPRQLLPELPADLSDLAMALLRTDPEVRPTSAVIASALALDVAPGSWPPRRPASGIVGREEERAEIASALAHARSGGAALVHLVGPSGVGKTTLLASLIDAARDEAIVLHARCYERESVPYKALDGLLDALATRLGDARDRSLADVPLPEWIGELVRVFPVLAEAPPVAARLADAEAESGSVPVLELRRRAAAALRELFTSLAARRPLVLAIDDLQWADADSVALLLHLLEAPAPPGLLLAASFRPGEAASSSAIAPYLDATRALESDAVRCLTVDVGPLARPAAERLAAETLAALGARGERDELAARIADEARGVPFHVEELARYAAQGGPGARLARGDVLAARIALLAPPERALLDVLAVAGSPVPLSLAFAAAGLESDAVLRALASLRAGRYARSTGLGADDRAELNHDGLREAALAVLPPARVGDLHLALGRAFADAGPASLFDAVRHLNAVADRLAGDERARAASLNLAAARRARRAAAFPLAFACFAAGASLLGERAWDDDYDRALALHGGASEAAYLSAAWDRLDAHVAAVKARGRTIFDQLVAWEVEIDAGIARRAYGAAVDAGVEALRHLGVDLPASPTEAQVGAEVERARVALARVGPEGLASLPEARDPAVTAAMRIEARVSSAAYFARPPLLTVLACRLVSQSVERGLSPATPYALAVYGVVCNALGALPEAHTWGRAALALLDRFDDESLAARTRHVVHDLVRPWMEPLAETLDDLRDVVALGRRTGDLEYAAYAAHAYVHNAFYAGRALEPLLEEALFFGAFLRSYGQVNALHVHAPFEQVLRAFTGRTPRRARLDGDGFTEEGALAVAEAAGSRSALAIVALLMGVVRLHFGSPEEASACLERGRPYLDGVVSTWHGPMLHQYAALAIHRLDPIARRARLGAADASLAALRALAAHAPANFAHRVALVEAERARAEGRTEDALASIAIAREGAARGGWHADLALVHDLAARVASALGHADEVAKHRAVAREAYLRWGAVPP